MTNYTEIIELAFPIMFTLMSLVIVVLLWSVLRNLKKVAGSLDFVLARTVNPNLMSLDEAMNVLEIHVNSAIIELRLTYKNKEAELSTQMDDVIKSRTSDLISNISQRHMESLEVYMSKKFIILFVSRNIREHVLDIVAKK